MTRPITIAAKPYGYIVRILVSSIEDGTKWLRRYGCDFSEDEGDFSGCTYEANGTAYIYVWVELNAPLSTLAHELIHATMAILAGSGVPVSPTKDETFAYLFAHLFDAYLAKTERKNLKCVAPKPRAAPVTKGPT